MRDYMDELLKEAYRDSVEITEGLEEAVSSEMTNQGKRKRSTFRLPTAKGMRRMRLRPVFAVLCGVLILGSAITTYGAAKGLSVDQLFAVIWGERQQKNSLQQFSTEVNVLAEKSSFKDIDIEPVQALSDGRIIYVVMKVTGINGFHLTDEMSFDAFSLDDAEKSTNSLNSYVLKREENTIYVALWALWNKMEETKEEQQECSIGIYNLYHAELDEMGRVRKIKHTLTEPAPEDGTSYERYPKESIAAEGDYHGKILCNVQNDQLDISTEEFGTFQVSALSVTTTQDISEELGPIDVDAVVDILMKDGSEVQAILSGSQSEGYAYDYSITDGFTAFELREPVDLKKVRGIRILGHIYDIEKK